MVAGLSKDDADVNIETLLAEFYDPETGFDQLGKYTSTLELPSPYNELLNHHKHMTVTVESHYGDKVDVVVHRHHRNRDDFGDWYAREITLKLQSSGKVVQYGIVRLNVAALDPKVWARIEARQTPLGRVLIEHHVLREVQLCELWKIQAGSELAKLLDAEVGDTVYGRTALIYCDGEPAIELFEVVAK